MDEKLSEHIHLFGDPEENFYALGLKDKERFGEIYTQITRLCARADFLATALKLSAEMAGNLSSKGSIDLNKELKAYADGLERPVSDVRFLLLLPEIVASFNKWIPNLMSIIPGCSSLFMMNKNRDGLLHGRVLDYAISGPFEKYERSSLFEFKGRLKVFGHASAGVPLPSLTSMNERGLTMALHYKHGNYLDLKGDSIFSIAYQIISYCSDIHDVKKFLKNYPSMSHWGIYVGDKNGEVASIDIRGREIYQEKFDLKDYPYLYFNNRPLLKDPALKTSQPYGALDQCKMRRDSMTKKLKNKSLKNPDAALVLELLTTPGQGSSKAQNERSSSNWNLSPITPSSIQAIAFDNKEMSSLRIPGVGPKIFRGEMIEASSIFDDIQFKKLKKKTGLDANYILAYENLAKFQSHLDAGKVEAAYHEIQMALELFDGYPERNIIQFFLYVLEYLYEGESKELAYLHQDFESLEGLLPSYLEDQRLLFLMRLEKILGHQVRSDAVMIKNKNLRKLYEKEKKLRPQALKLLRKFIFPRIEMLDILYAY